MTKAPAMLAVAALLLFGASAHAQPAEGGPSNPFLDRADTGEIIHVLPSPASIRSPHDTHPSIRPVTAPGT